MASRHFFSRRGNGYISIRNGDAVAQIEQLLHIGLYDRRVVHVHIHRREKQDGSWKTKDEHRKEIIGDSVGSFG
ncbi:hypothetical protein D3C86_2115540 [compost metagenome]